MSRVNLNIKRQLLADLFEGKTDNLRTYQRKQVISAFLFRWVIDARAIDGTITTIDKQGNKSLMSEQDFEQIPTRAPIWRVVDHTGGIKTPEIDEEY
ncbi:hypothetical protein [Spirosoma arcticum]